MSAAVSGVVPANLEKKDMNAEPMPVRAVDYKQKTGGQTRKIEVRQQHPKNRQT